MGLKERIAVQKAKWYNQVLPVWNQRGGGETFAEKRGNFPSLRELGCSMVHFIPKILERLASSLPVTKEVADRNLPETTKTSLTSQFNLSNLAYLAQK